LQLFNQLRYFVYLFNGEKAKKSASGSSDIGKPTYPMHSCDYLRNIQLDKVEALVNQNCNLLQTLGECVERYLDLSGRRWVDLGGLFSFMKL
jgi:DNA polymerase alpha subunit A